MLEINIKMRADIPIYRQIMEQIKQMIASYQIIPGERVPTVRDLASSLNVNPATVARAYKELGQEGILGASRRRGTIVMGESNSPLKQPLRQGRLAGIVNNVILETLSQGYRAEELEAAFSLQMARWRFQRTTRENICEGEVEMESPRMIRIVGSNDMALDLLVSRMKYNHPEISVQLTPAGSLGGLLAIQEGKADMAGIHLLDEETGEYNYPHIHHTLQGIEVAVVHLADRIQGFMVAKSNPKQIMCLDDLNRPDIIFVNRQKGSGTRVWLDYKLREIGILPHNIRGYNHELDTHIAVAMSIFRNEADVGLGIQAAANSCNLDFIPLTKEKFDLVIPLGNFRSKLFAPLLEIIKSEEFKQVISKMGGYDISQTGETVFIK
ncbi:MAG: GntR family transcriptional regulator [Dehalococcoidales bacterium]|nr:GntR family transcriptional regulator [Dehalococcoidales bacterium]